MDISTSANASDWEAARISLEDDNVTGLMDELAERYDETQEITGNSVFASESAKYLLNQRWERIIELKSEEDRFPVKGMMLDGNGEMALYIDEEILYELAEEYDCLDLDYSLWSQDDIETTPQSEVY